MIANQIDYAIAAATTEHRRRYPGLDYSGISARVITTRGGLLILVEIDADHHSAHLPYLVSSSGVRLLSNAAAHHITTDPAGYSAALSARVKAAAHA